MTIELSEAAVPGRLQQPDMVTIISFGYAYGAPPEAHAVFDVRKNRSQIQLLGRRPMMIGKIRHWLGEVLIPFRPVFSLQKFIGILEH